MTPAQQYARKFRSWYVRRRVNFCETPYPFGEPPPSSLTRLDSERSTDWPWTRYESASAAAYERLGRWR
jgi:hypothetical protein